MAIDPTTLKRKPYLATPIKECGEPLVAIPREHFGFFEPHAYQALGAPYGGASPWMLRSGVLKALQQVQNELAKRRPGWKIMVFDAYRPVAVQTFMFAREYGGIAESMGLAPLPLDEAARAGGRQGEAYAGALRIFAIPSEDPAMPPPHSTGAAVDCTLMDEKGREVYMGSPIDENSDRSNPGYFETRDAAAHANRVLLNELMMAGGFRRNPREWWHFSQGDQSAVWLEQQESPRAPKFARYGRADLVK